MVIITMLLELHTGIQEQLSNLTRQKGAMLGQVSTENAIRKTTTTLIFVKYYCRKLEMTLLNLLQMPGRE